MQLPDRVFVLLLIDCNWQGRRALLGAGWPFVQQPSKAQYPSTLHLDCSFTIVLTPPVQDIFDCRTLWHPFHLVHLITQLPHGKSCPLYQASMWCRSIFLRLLFRPSLLDLYNVIGVYCSKSCHLIRPVSWSFDNFPYSSLVSKLLRRIFTASFIYLIKSN